MIDSTLYSLNNDSTKDSAKFVIQKYKGFLKWSDNENILDVGCGDFGATFEALAPELPQNIKNILGVDISPEMVRIAKEKFASPRIDFEVLDISSTPIPVRHHAHYHHIFSFLCLHWVSEEKQALRNMFHMLTSGGQLFLTALVRIPMMSALMTLSKSDKWQAYMRDIDRNISPYYTKIEPAGYFEKVLEDVGFECQICKIEKRTFVFLDEAKLKNISVAVNPYINSIPLEEREYFLQDYIDAVLGNEDVQIIEAGKQKKILLTYTMLVALAHKL